MSTTYDPITDFPATHDDFFIKFMSDLRVAKEFFQQYLPTALLKAIDLDGIEICKDKFHTAGLKSKITDMLYRAPFRDYSQPAYISALVEHQSTPQKHMPLRILMYKTAIMQQHWERYETVPLVYTIVYYNGQARWNYARDITALIQAPPDLVDRYALQPFQLIELNQISDQELRRSLWAGVMSLAMKHIFDRDVLPALQSFMDFLRRIERQHAGDIYIQSILCYMYKRGEIWDEKRFHDLLSMELFKESGEKTMTFGEFHTQQGLQQGIQQGEQNKSREIAQNLLREGLNPDLVAKATGVNMCDIAKIAKELLNEIQPY